MGKLRRGDVDVLADDGVLRVEEAGLGEEGLGLVVLAEEAGFAGLLHQFGDVVLVGEGEGPGVVAVGGVELDRFVELGLGAGEVVVVEQAGAGEVGVFGGLGLVFAGCAEVASAASLLAGAVCGARGLGRAQRRGRRVASATAHVAIAEARG